ncbi:MAG: hypothetical protein JSS34_00900 [Proteobacteria bacterium]|nr:hypothetical protein [Pseudomonadota bacterium]
MMLTEEILFRELKKSPYLPIKFPISRYQLEEAASSFLKFLELPENLKTHIDLKIAPLHRRGDIGFKHRDSAADIYNDTKDFFHFHPLIFEKYGSFLNENSVIQDFLTKANLIWTATHSVVKELMGLIDQRFPGTTQKVFDTDHVHILLRFLKYDWKECGKYLAKPHFDAGSFTLAIAESCPGLRIGKGPDDLKIINHQEDHALFMISSNFKKTINTNELSPAWHDVIQCNETQIGQPFSRWAIVAFIDAANVEALDKSETHKWPVVDLS